MLDGNSPERQQVSIQVYDRLREHRRVVLSAQCLTEFLNAVTRRLSPAVPIDEAMTQVQRISATALVHPVTADVVIDAARAMRDYQMSIWDALIWAVAYRNSVSTIVTEDMQSQPIIGGIQYVNPFDTGFDLESL